MAISDRKKRETEILRHKVLDAAEDLILTEGLERVTMRRLAARVEYAPTVLYRLFTGKDDLLDHLIARSYAGMRSGYKEVLGHRDIDPLKTLGGVLSVYATYALDHPHHYQMWFETGKLRLEKGWLKMSHGRLDFVVFQAWLKGIEDCRQAGLFPGQETLEVFQILWPRMHGLIILRLQHPDYPWPLPEQHLTEVLGLDRLAK